MNVTIEQIAERVGVSPGTVSRVLNGKNKENRPTMIRRARQIRKIAAELGYRPNLAARQMVRGKFDLIGFLNCGETGQDWFPRRLLHGLHDQVTASGSRLAITEIPSQRFDEPDFAPDVLRESMVDGLVAHLGLKVVDQASAMFDAGPLPVTYVNHRAKYNAVYPDEAMGGRMITHKMIELGHRHIGFLTSGGVDESCHFSEAERIRGYRTALRQAKLPDDRYLVQGPRWDVDHTVPPMLDYLDSHPKLTAVVVYKYELAVAFREAALRRGRLDRISIAVFHDAPYQGMSGIPMTTVLIPFRQIGVEAAEMVLQLVEDATRLMPAVKVPYKQIQGLDCLLPPVL